MIGAFFIKRTGNYSYTEDVQSGSGIAYLAEKKGSAIQFGMELDFIRLRKTMVSAGPIFSTVGGKLFLGKATNIFIADVNNSQTTIDVKYNNLTNGDRIYLDANSNIEWMAITSSATPITGGYRYSVTRNLDGSGANSWYSGDNIFNTGAAGEGFIDIYATQSIKGASQPGPTMVGNIRNSTTYNDFSEHWAVGNLNGLYGYNTTTFGAAFGKYAAGVPNITIDSTNGIRFRNYTTQLAQWDASGNILIGEVGANKSNIYITSGAVKLRNNATDFIVLNADGSATFAGSITSTATITGGTFQTASSGKRIVLDGATNSLKFYDSNGSLGAELSGVDGQLSLGAYQIVGFRVYDGVSYSNQMNSDQIYIWKYTSPTPSTFYGCMLSSTELKFGAGSDGYYGTLDVNLYRGAANVLKTDDALHIAAGLFQVDINGDITKLKNLAYSWPSSHVAGYLKNNGSGTLTWTAIAVTDLTAITASKIAVTDASGFLAASSVASSTLFTPAYGEMYDNGSLTAIGIDAEWGVWSGSTTGDCSSNVTYNAAADKLTVSDAGVYEVSFTISFYTDFTNEVLWAIWKNGIASGTELVKSKTAYGVTSGITYTAVGKCYVSLSANDYIVLAVYYGNAGTITTRLGNVSLRKISN